MIIRVKKNNRRNFRVWTLGAFIVVVVIAVVWIGVRHTKRSASTAPFTSLPNTPWQAGGDLSYNGNPIDPSCLNDILGNSDDGDPTTSVEVANLDTCPVAPAGGTVTKDDDTGYLEDDYTVDSSDVAVSPGTHVGSASYKVVASKGDEFVVLSLINGGGSGEFSYLSLVKESGNHLILDKNLTDSGDRCDGGITGATLQGSVISYDRNVTPFAIQVLGSGEDGTSDSVQQKYQGLSNSAVSCYATATSLYDLNTGTDQFQYLTTANAGPEGGNPTETCFDTLYGTAMDANNGILNKAELTTLSGSVEGQCFSVNPS